MMIKKLLNNIGKCPVDMVLKQSRKNRFFISTGKRGFFEKGWQVDFF